MSFEEALKEEDRRIEELKAKYEMTDNHINLWIQKYHRLPNKEESEIYLDRLNKRRVRNGLL